MRTPTGEHVVYTQRAEQTALKDEFFVCCVRLKTHNSS
jgi:hypothetical protein